MKIRSLLTLLLTFANISWAAPDAAQVVKDALVTGVDTIIDMGTTGNKFDLTSSFQNESAIVDNYGNLIIMWIQKVTSEYSGLNTFQHKSIYPLSKVDKVQVFNYKADNSIRGILEPAHSKVHLFDKRGNILHKIPLPRGSPVSNQMLVDAILSLANQAKKNN